MRVLVTGASGRLGSVLVDRLTGEGHIVRAMSRRTRPVRDGVEWVVADLAEGVGVERAVHGMDVVVHLASAPYRGRYTERVESGGTRLLASAARDAGVAHLVYTSIVGVHRIPWGYFASKYRAEKIVESSGVPFTILRATQFHELVNLAMRGMSRLGVLAVDRAISAQPVDVRDVADRLLPIVAGRPTGGTEDFGGPEILGSGELARQWSDVTGRRRPVLPIKVPGGLGRAFRAGHLTTSTTPTGTRTWAQYLESL
ncbi:SDR family oxidoreductase [Pseudonocardia spinosispora]|uniref:SDR family oxidoreductase n=1 Tax=Pseudonocardia spinosispora TaxID=103441 RepID=UPI000490C585|nr:NAD(P)H-binding protein [Pseudonocardia spinosispora]